MIGIIVVSALSGWEPADTSVMYICHVTRNCWKKCAACQSKSNCISFGVLSCISGLKRNLDRPETSGGTYGNTVIPKITKTINDNSFRKVPPSYAIQYACETKPFQTSAKRYFDVQWFMIERMMATFLRRKILIF